MYRQTVYLHPAQNAPLCPVQGFPVQYAYSPLGRCTGCTCLPELVFGGALAVDLGITT